MEHRIRQCSFLQRKSADRRNGSGLRAGLYINLGEPRLRTSACNGPRPSLFVLPCPRLRSWPAAVTVSYAATVALRAHYLSLFDASGNFLASTFFGTTCPPGALINPTSGACFDVLLDGGTLGAGGYQIAISAFENLSLAENLGSGTLADGFTGLGDLEPGEDLHYAFNVTLTSTSPVPEPSYAWPLTAAAILGWQYLNKTVRNQFKEKT